MEKVNNTQIVFYQKLGEFFYAIAASDRRVHKFETFKNLIMEEWQELGKYEDHFHSDALNQMEVELDWLKYQHKGIGECYACLRSPI